MSKLVDKILAGLRDIGYNGPIRAKFDLEAAAEVGQKSEEYTTLVNFLTNEIRTLLGIDEEVNAVKSPEDAVAFIMEITSFLKELNCPYNSLTDGLVSERLQNVSDRLLLLDYLITELMGARILQEKKPEKKIELKLQETPEGSDMRQILQTLRFPKPPGNITLRQLFDKLDTTVPIVLKKAGMDIIGQGIFNGHLSDKQWQTLDEVAKDLFNEYKIRREMLLTRLDVTIQSFQWSDRTKGKDELFEKIYHDKRSTLKVDPDVDIADLIAARNDLAVIEKTSSSSVRKNTRTAVNKVIIGQVPDRGGRSWEQPPPPPEMPPWQQRSSGPSFGGGRGGGNQQNFSRGGGGGNRGNTFSGGGNTYGRGGNSYGGGGKGYGGSGNAYSGTGNAYSGSGNAYSGSGNAYGGASNAFSGSGNSFSGGRNDYKDNFQSRSSGGYQSGNYKSSFDSAGSYSSRDTRDYDNKNYGGGSTLSSSNRGYDSYGGSNYNRGGGGGGGGYDRRDSGGSYGSLDYQQTKRPKTYDSFQANKSTYADQYVQEKQHNQQYQQRGGRDQYSSSSRGRSNYHRGGGSYR